MKNTPKKIVFVSHNLNYEGATISLYQLALGLQTKLYSNCVCLSPKDGPLKHKYFENSIPIHIFDSKSRLISILDDLIFNKDYDLFFVNTIVQFKELETIKAYKKKVYWIIRESERTHYFNEFPDLKEELFTLADKIIFVSNATEHIYKDLNIKKNFRVIYNGIDNKIIERFVEENDRDKIKKKMGIGKNEKVIITVGTVCQRKGQIELVKAYSLLINSNLIKNVRVFIVGGRKSRYQDELKKVIEERRLEKQVVIIPETPDVFNYYHIADIFVNNSYIESLPRTILEAMAFQLPIIATKVYGNSELIKNNLQGLIVSAGNEYELANAMLRLINDSKIAKKLAKTARSKVFRQFGIDKMINNYIELIKE